MEDIEKSKRYAPLVIVGDKMLPNEGVQPLLNWLFGEEVDMETVSVSGLLEEIAVQKRRCVDPQKYLAAGMLELDLKHAVRMQ